MSEVVEKNSFLYKLYAIPGLTMVAIFEFLIRLASPNHKFFPTEDFPWARELEANWRDVRAEVDALLAEESIPEFKSISQEQARISRGAPWNVYLMYAYGKKIEENCSKCPKTDALVQKIPGMKTAMFSVLQPGANLAPHRGPFKGLIRYQLAVKVPEDAVACGIRIVDEASQYDETRHWKEGSSMVFDDTFEHEAWNRSSETRVVLFVDFMRELPWPLSMLNHGLVWLFSVSPFVQNIITSVNEKTGRVQDAKMPDAKSNT